MNGSSRCHLWRTGTWLQGTLPCSDMARQPLGVRWSQGTRSRHPFRTAAAPLQTRSLCGSLVLLEMWVGKLPLLHWGFTVQGSQYQEPAARLRQIAPPSHSLVKHKAALPQLMQLPGKLTWGPAASLLQMGPPHNSLLKRKAALPQPPHWAMGALSWSAPLLQLLGRPACHPMAARAPCSPIVEDPGAVSLVPGGCLSSVSPLACQLHRNPLT